MAAWTDDVETSALAQYCDGACLTMEAEQKRGRNPAASRAAHSLLPPRPRTRAIGLSSEIWPATGGMAAVFGLTLRAEVPAHFSSCEGASARALFLGETSAALEDDVQE